MVDEIKRMRYFDGQFLNAADFQLEQEYFLRWRRRINRYLFGWGVLCGLEVVADNTRPQGIVVKPGLALDRVMIEGEALSREIVIVTDQHINLSEYDEDKPIYITLKYLEEESDPEPVRNTDYKIHFWEHGEVNASLKKPDGREVLLLAAVTLKSDQVKGKYIDSESINYTLRSEAGLAAQFLALTSPGENLRGQAKDDYIVNTIKIGSSGNRRYGAGIQAYQLKGGLSNDVRLDLCTCPRAPKGADDIAPMLSIMPFTGNVGIGTTDPKVRLHVNGDTRLVGKLTVNGAIESSQGGIIPTGTIIAYGASAVPTGWFECDGSEKSRTEFETLFHVIGTNFGDGDGKTTFKLPDLRGEFIRGYDKKRGVDSKNNRQFGSNQSGQIEAHKHISPFGESKGRNPIYGETERGDYLGYQGNMNNNNTQWFTNDGSNQDGQVNADGVIGNETRPRNVALMYIIKY
jgi:microcystin-dependent protein